MLGTHAARLTAPGLVIRGRAWLRACVPPLAGLRKTANAIAAGAPIGRGERVLAGGRQANGALVAATVRAVYYQDGSAAGRSWSRLGWEEVDQVLWDDEQCTLTLGCPGRSGSYRVSLRLTRHAPLVEFARERVTSTTLARAPLLSGGHVCGWLTARRSPGSDRVRWVLVLQDATAAGDPALQARVTGMIAALEADLGLTSLRLTGTRESPHRAWHQAGGRRPRGGLAGGHAAPAGAPRRRARTG